MAPWRPKPAGFCGFQQLIVLKAQIVPAYLLEKVIEYRWGAGVMSPPRCSATNLGAVCVVEGWPISGWCLYIIIEK
jgi:hypothetical protein